MAKVELTPEEKKRGEEMLAELDEEIRRGLPEPPEHWRRKMDEEALTNAALAKPGPARDAFLDTFPDAASDAASDSA